MKKFLPALTVGLAAVAPIFAPDAQAFIANYPQLSAGISALALVLSYLAPSPVHRNVKPSADQN